ncbi:MAG: imidazole glycerol phosphate synthase subunit HisF [Spirochaetes bacterium]|uniref:Imidazole glycerol phosphate synthase subunit HisF n=1 Tax=Candidatus Ornithospirochaeta stercoripullorum TaxID=2840899 RepID=A0A9D9H5C7_9SPIO|nr:imidazole glycerol phosphate synthase subunit HisF [Candidatus Ornithospirochaeta stercoripullorum]
MLARRIIPCLDVKDGRTVKGINFVNLRDAGSALENAEYYSSHGADELVFLDITATVENRRTMEDLVRSVALSTSIPFTVGGGIKGEDDVARLLGAGADKISINSAALRNPEIIDKLASRFGSQCIVLALDAKANCAFPSGFEAFVDGGRTPAGKDALEWAKEASARGAGEILLTSMDKDGTRDGFAVDLTKIISSNIDIPVIASGGAGKMADFKEIFEEGKADAALAASVFHFHEIDIPELKDYLRQSGIPVR